MNIVKEIESKGISVAEIAEYFGISVATVYAHRKNGNSTILKKMCDLRGKETIIRDIKLAQFLNTYKETVQYVPECLSIAKNMHHS